MSLNITNSFVPHTDIKAEDMNQNFTDIQTWANNLGLWQDYTPVWTAATTPCSLGNGTITGRYVEIGKFVVLGISLTFGTTTTFGTGQFNFTLPVPAATGTTRWWGSALGNHTGIAVYHGLVGFQSDTQLAIFHHNDTAGGWKSSNPASWNTTDSIRLTICYERA